MAGELFVVACICTLGFCGDWMPFVFCRDAFMVGVLFVVVSVCRLGIFIF